LGASALSWNFATPAGNGFARRKRLRNGCLIFQPGISLIAKREIRVLSRCKLRQAPLRLALQQYRAGRGRDLLAIRKPVTFREAENDAGEEA
jgi:hypothetical protein